MIKIHRYSLLALLALVAGCSAVPTTEESREVLWGEYGGKPLDALLVAWGAPEAETTLTDGSRMVKYRRSTTYDSGSSMARRTSCEVTFMAKSPKFFIENIAMEGAPGDCSRLAAGKRGDVALPGPMYRDMSTYPYGYYRVPY